MNDLFFGAHESEAKKIARLLCAHIEKKRELFEIPNWIVEWWIAEKAKIAKEKSERR